MRPLLLPATLVVLLPVGCCATQVSTTGYQRQCVWSKRGPGPAATRSTSAVTPPAAEIDELDLAWLPELGVYSVGVRPCTFYRLGRFYRQQDRDWETATSVAGPWSSLPKSELPPGLRRAQATACDAAERAPGSD